MPTTNGKMRQADIDGLPDKPAKEYVLADGYLTGFCIRCYPSGRKIYAVRYATKRRNGWVKIGSVAVNSLDEARAEAMIILGNIEKGDLPPRRGDANHEPPQTINELVERWLTEGPQDRPDKREGSWYRERNTLRNHVLPLIGHWHPEEVRTATLAKLQRDVADGKTARWGKSKTRPVSGGPSAGAHAVRAISAAFGWAVEREWLIRNPAAGVKKLPDGARHRFLTQAQAIRLFEVIDELVGEEVVMPVQADCIKLIALTGARSGEIRALKWSEVDWDRQLIMLPPTRHKTGGNNIPKSIPLSAPALDILIERQAAKYVDDEYVFVAYSMFGYLRDIRHSWLKICERVGLVDFRIHDLRHAYASFAINAGESLQNIGANLGHKRTTTTERYAHLMVKTRRPVADGVANAYLPKGYARPDHDSGKVVPFPRGA